MKDQSEFRGNDLCGCEWDRMSTWKKCWFWVFIVSMIAWGAPIYELTFGINLFSTITMPIIAIVAVVSGFFSGTIPMILESFEK